MLSSSEGSPSVLTAPRLSLGLRVCEAEGSRWTVLVPEGKCTIGSSPKCRVRLSHPSVQPLHCLIVHGEDETTITRWAAGVQLNGLDFTSARLNPGDRIAIGDVALEVVELEAVDATEQNFATEKVSGEPLEVESKVSEGPVEATEKNHKRLNEIIPSEPVAPHSAGDSRLLASGTEATARSEVSASGDLSKNTDALASSDRLVRHLQLANNNARSRCRDLLAALRDTQRRSTESRATNLALEVELLAAQEERQRLANALELEQAEAAEHRAQFAAEQRRYESELAASRQYREHAEHAIQQHEADRERWQTELAASETDCERLASECSSNGQRLQELERHLAERDRRLGESHDELESLRGQLEQTEQLLLEHVAETERLHEIESRLIERDGCLEDLSSELATVRNRLQQAERRADERSDECERLETECAKSHATNEQLASAQSRSDEQQQALQQVLSDRDARIEQLLGKLEEARAELNQITERTNHFDQEQSASLTKLEQLRCELESVQSQRDAAIASTSEAQRERDELNTQLQAARQEKGGMELRCSKFEAELADLADENGAWQEEKDSLDQQLNRRAKQVEQLQLDLETVRDQYAESEKQLTQIQKQYDAISELESARRQAQASAEDQAAGRPDEDNRSSPAGGEAAEQAIARLRELSVWKDSTATENTSEAEQVEFEEDSQAEQFSPPTSFIESYNHLIEENSNSDSPEEGQLGTNPGPPSADASTSPMAMAPEETGETDAVSELEAYMANLMKRTRGVTGAALGRPEYACLGDAPSISAEKIVSQPDSISESEALAVEQEPIEPCSLGSPKPASQRPVKQADILAMRELANSSARRAIATHSHRHYFEAAIGKIVTCGIAMVTAIFLMMKATSYSSVTFIGGCISAFAAAYWGVQLLRIVLQVIRSGSWDEETPAELPMEENPLPIAGQAENEPDKVVNNEPGE